MFSFLSNLFRKKKAEVKPVAVAAHVPAPLPKVETAALSLLAIMQRFPDDLRKLVVKLPPPDAMVALPLPTILKYLPTGSVKMSLASIVRQAPPGTFSQVKLEDRRTVEVPLAEIFKRVSPSILKRRDDQRYTELADDGFDIFGDEENPYALAPRVDGEANPSGAAKPSGVRKPSTIRKPDPFGGAPKSSVVRPPKANNVQPAPAGVDPAAAIFQPMPRASVAPTPAVPAPAAAAPAAPAPAPAARPVADDQPPLVLPIADLLGAWPDPIKTEAAALSSATVALPSAQVDAGLKRGKVAFTWGQIRSWLNPPASAPSLANEATEVQLPLRVVAPAFLKHSKAATPRKTVAVTDEIPSLFTGGTVKAPAPSPEAPAPTPAPAPAAEAETQPASAPAAAPSAEFEVVPAPSEPLPVPPSFATTVAPAPAAPAPAAPTPVSTPESAEAKAETEPEAKTEALAPSPALAAEAAATKPEATAPAPEADASEAKPAPAEKPAKAEKQKKADKAEKTEKAEKADKAATAEKTEKPEVPAPSPAPAAAAEPAKAPAQTVGEVFGKPEKDSWSPNEVLEELTKLPQFAGGIVALQEGFVVAHRLPEGLTGDVFAAFMPQIFARINQYAGEMKLGGVEELFLTAGDAQLAIFRRGQVYFAALGKPSETLPAHDLRIIAAEVAKQ